MQTKLRAAESDPASERPDPHQDTNYMANTQFMEQAENGTLLDAGAQRLYFKSEDCLVRMLSTKNPLNNIWQGNSIRVQAWFQEYST